MHFQHPGAEGVPRPGGLDDAAQLAGGNEYPLILIEGVAAVPSGGDAAQLNVGILGPLPLLEA